MLAKVYSCAVVGLEGALVEVEVDTANGLPSLVDVGSDSQFLVQFMDRLAKPTDQTKCG